MSPAHRSLGRPVEREASPHDLQTIRVTHSARGRRLLRPVVLQLPAAKSRGEESLRAYVIDSLSRKMPTLIPFTLRSEGLVNVAKHLQRHATASTATLYLYVYGVWRFCEWVGRTPDEILAECKDARGAPNLKTLANHARLVDDYIGECQAGNMAPGTIGNHVKAVKALYQASGLVLPLPYRLPRTVKFRDRSPTAEELASLLHVAKLREKVIVTCLALGGFRVGTLCRLRYRHVKADLERGVIPLHVHVEAEITKGKYSDYDTFLGQEAVDCLKAYLELRRRGNPLENVPPEEITDESMLIRGIQYGRSGAITPSTANSIVHSLYAKAGLIGDRRQRRYALRTHSLRKYFRTQLTALGMPVDYIEYMMGHRISSYHDVQMKGLEFLRNVYATSGLSISPKGKVGLKDVIMEMIRAGGQQPERILTEEALAKPWRTYASPEEREDDHVKALAGALKEMLRRELLDG